MRTLPLTNRGLHLPAIVKLGLLTVLAALLASASAVSAQSSAPVTPDRPTGTVVFIGGVDLEWNDVPGADSYDVQLYRNGQWIDLPGDGVEIAFYGAGAIIRELDPTSSLWFQVRARNAHGISDWSDFHFMASTNQYESGRQARPDNVAASGAPVINGTPLVGETLTADTAGIVDANGLDRVEFRFQWVSNDGSADTDITGGTDSTYTLVADDAGKPIKVRVSFTDRGGYAETLTSDVTVAATVLANNPATGAPTITGTAQVGQTLTADTAGIADDDGLSGATFSYQWVANDGNADTDIAGATDSSYTLVADDEGKTIKVRVSFTDDAVNDESLTSDATEAVAARPNSPATGAPAISGTAQVGETLTADTAGIADDDGLSGATFSYQWVSNDGTADRDITGATDSSYVLVAADEGTSIKVRVSFTDDAANDESLTSDATEAVAARHNSPATGAPAITGTAQVGQTLASDTAGIADTDGLSGATFSYQWVSNDGTTDTDITGATDSTYTLVAADEDKTIKVRVSFTDDAGFDETLTSTATEEVSFAVQQQRANSPATGGPAITGTAQVGETLTADTAGIADADGLSGSTFSYQWIANDGATDADITGATDSTYVLAAADEGKTIKVRVTFTDDADNDETLTSAATAAVAAASEADDGDESSLRSYITVVVADDQSDPDNVVTSLAITWSDVDECSSGYNAFISNDPEDGHTHLGSAASDGAQIISSLTNITWYYIFFNVDLYCGTQKWGRRVSGVRIPYYIDGRLLPDTYSSEPPLTGLTVNHGTLAPAFHSHTFGYTVPDVANSARRITVNVTAKDGYEYEIAPMEGENSYIVGYSDPWRLSEWFISYSPSGNPFDPLSDADADSPGFQIDLEVGENQFQIRVYRPGRFGDFYKLTITRAPGPPGAPQHLNVSPHDSGALDLYWEAPASDGGSEITGYRVQWKEAADSWDTPADLSETTVTGTDHTITGLTDGVQYTVRVIAVNDLGDSDPSEEATGTPGETSAPDPAQNTPATGAPTITGTARVGETLTADTSQIDDADGLTPPTFSYQWLADDADISGATGATYTLVSTAEGKTITVRVSFTDDGGNEETLTSAATAQVLPTNTPATGLIGITGSVEVGQILTADTSQIDDANGIANAVFNYQWIRSSSGSDTDIADANGSTYTLTDSDANQSIKVRVSFTDDAGNAEQLTSPPAAVPPTPIWSATLTVGVDTSYVPEFTGYSIWGEDIGALSSQSFRLDGRPYRVLTVLHLGGGLYLNVSRELLVDFKLAIGDQEFVASGSSKPSTPAAGRYWWSATNLDWADGDMLEVSITATEESSEVLPVRPQAPPVAYFMEIPDNHNGTDPFTFKFHLTEEVQLSDGTLRDHCLEVNNGTVTNAERAEQGSNRKWTITVEPDSTKDITITLPATTDCAAVGAICTDDGRKLHSSVEIIVSATEARQEPVQNSPATGAPTINGTAQVGQTLTADTSGISDADGLANVSYSYQWVSNDGTTDTDITGSTDSTYTLVAADEGKTIKVRVSFTDDADNEETLAGEATAAVEPRPNSPATGQPVIIGTAQVGETLTPDTSGIADSDGLTHVSYSYQWIRNDGTSDSDITGATDSTYTLVAADEDKAIKVRVSFTDDADNDEGLISTATDEVAATPSPLTVSLANNPASHNGTDVFTFQIRFSEETRLSFGTLRDQAFTVTGGTVKKAKRQVKGSNMGWTITVEPDSNAAVEIVLPTTTDCATTGAICTGEGRKLSNRLEFRVSGPNQ